MYQICDKCFFFFKQKTAYEMRISDWSSDVCSSDLTGLMDHAKLAALQDPDSIFSGLTGQDWTDIAGRAVQIAFVRGRELLTQGEAGDSLLILTEGSARV